MTRHVTAPLTLENMNLKESICFTRSRQAMVGRWKIQYVQNGAPKSSDPEIYESSWYAKKVNKLTLGMVTLTHRFENVEWEIGTGMKWDKPSNKN